MAPSALLKSHGGDVAAVASKQWNFFETEWFMYAGNDDTVRAHTWGWRRVGCVWGRGGMTATLGRVCSRLEAEVYCSMLGAQPRVGCRHTRCGRRGMATLATRSSSGRSSRTGAAMPQSSHATDTL